MSQYDHNFKTADSHLDPPDIKDVHEEKYDYLSVCCTLPPMFPIHDGLGLCIGCSEMVEFIDENGELPPE